jgi:hypothetical protein
MIWFKFRQRCIAGTFLSIVWDRFESINVMNNGQNNLAVYQSLRKSQELSGSVQTFPLRKLLSTLLPTLSPTPPFPN